MKKIFGIFILFLIIASIPIVCNDLPPLVDYVPNLWAMNAINSFEENNLKRFYYKTEVSPLNSYSLIFILSEIMGNFFSIYSIGKIIILLYITLYFASFLYGSLILKRHSFFAMSSIFIFNMIFFIGMLNFTLSVPFSFFMIFSIFAIFRNKEKKIQFKSHSIHLIILFICSILLYFSHPVNYLYSIITIFLLLSFYIIQGFFEKVRAAFITLLPSFLLFTLYIIRVLFFTNYKVNNFSIPINLSKISYKNFLVDFVYFFSFMSEFKDYIDILIYFIPTTLIIYFFYLKIKKATKENIRLIKTNFSFKEKIKKSITCFHNLYIFILLSIIYFILPYHIQGFTFVKIRLLPIIYLFLLLSIENNNPVTLLNNIPKKKEYFNLDNKDTKTNTDIIIFLLFFILINIYLFYKYSDYSHQISNFRKIEASMKRDCRILPLIFGPEGNLMIRLKPFWFIPQLYNIDKGGFNPYTYAHSWVYKVRFRDDLNITAPKFFKPFELTENNLLYYDYVLIYNENVLEQNKNLSRIWQKKKYHILEKFNLTKKRGLWSLYSLSK